MTQDRRLCQEAAIGACCSGFGTLPRQSEITMTFLCRQLCACGCGILLMAWVTTLVDAQAPAGQPAGTVTVTVRVTDNAEVPLSSAQDVAIEIDRAGPRVLTMLPARSY